MDKRTIGIFMLVIGIAGGFAAGYSFMNGSGNMQNMLEVLIYSITGSCLFFWGIDYASNSLHTSAQNHSHTFPEQES